MLICVSPRMCVFCVCYIYICNISFFGGQAWKKCNNFFWFSGFFRQIESCWLSNCFPRFSLEKQSLSWCTRESDISVTYYFSFRPQKRVCTASSFENGHYILFLRYAFEMATRRRINFTYNRSSSCAISQKSLDCVIPFYTGPD